MRSRRKNGLATSSPCSGHPDWSRYLRAATIGVRGVLPARARGRLHRGPMFFLLLIVKRAEIYITYVLF
jgi:hypothetical protein